MKDAKDRTYGAVREAETALTRSDDINDPVVDGDRARDFMIKARTAFVESCRHG